MPMPNLGLYYRIAVHNADGRLARRTRLRKCHSYVQQFTKMLLCTMSNVSGPAATDIAASSDTLNTTANVDSLATDGAATEDTLGPVVGTGTTAVTISDTKLETQIAHGAGTADQLEYAVTVFGSHTVAGSTASFTMSRVFTNSSGGSITINEVGIYAAFWAGAPAIHDYLMVRDIVSGGQAVANTQTATLEYVIRTTV